MTKAVFNMEPFTCPSCVRKIESTVSKADGVQEVQVMFNSGRVRVEFDEGKTTADDIQDTIEKLGYTVLSQKVS
ncbi:MAG: heavy-metal-associated domain-containing protein [Alcaligenaceae bacterium]|nr:heavy-metal-associated domain-containing protein [Alcaligenaceae bacterium]